MDELLDFMIAGPKLRKWYGESDEMEAAGGGGGGGGGGGDFDGLPRDGDRGEAATTGGAAAAATSTSSSPPPSLPSSSSALPPAPEGTRDAVVVVSADGGPVAEAVLLQLILATGEAEDLGFFGEEGGAGLFDDELLLLPPENSDDDDDDDDDFEPAIDFPEPRPKTFLVPLVKDREAALSSFGKYAVPVDERDGKGVQEALKRARAVVVAGGGWEKVLELLPLLLREGSSAASAPAPHPRLVALVGDGQRGGGLGALLAGLGGGNEAAAVSDPKREAALRSSASSSSGGVVPLTLIRAVGGVRDAPGGGSLMIVGSRDGDVARSERPVAAGDAASALAAAALLPSEVSSSSSSSSPPTLVEFRVSDAGPGAPPGDWAAAVSEAVLVASRK